MKASSEDMYEKLQEMVQDEDKIVTVPFLSKTLGIPVQDSSNILKKYIEDQRKINSTELAVTYVLTGILKDAKSTAVFMVKEPDMPSKRDLFENIVSEVVFSVQKSKNVDFNIIALVDWFEVAQDDDKPLLGAVVTKNCSKRTLKFKKLPSPPPPTLRGKSSFFIPKSEIKPEKTVEPSSEVKNKPSRGITSLLSKAAASKSNQEVTDKSKALQQNKNFAKQKGGLSNFLTKNLSQSSQSSNNGSSEDIRSKELKLNGKHENNLKENKDKLNTQDDPIKDIDDVMEVDFSEVEKIRKPEEKEQKQRKGHKENKHSNKRRRQDSNEKNSKKRKRIIERNDSDSDDIFDKDEENIIEPSDEETERVPSPIPITPLAPKNKRRKAVDKTYQDEEGFIVTKTEYIYETASEDEVEGALPVPKIQEKPVRKSVEKKASTSSENDTPSQKGQKGKKTKKNNLQNQPTLMNFFKKN